MTTDIADAHDALDEWGIPSVRESVSLTLRERISILGEDREQTADKLSELWIHLDMWARGDVQFTADAAKSILRKQKVPGWPVDLSVGAKININDECVGMITKETEDRIYIESSCFTGWATKQEIRDSIFSERRKP